MAPQPAPLMARQPLSAIYTLCYIATILARIPYWTLKFGLFSSLRPVPTWTLKQSLMVTLTKVLVHMACVVQKPVLLSLEPGKEKENFCVANPASKADYVGPLMTSAVSPAPIGITCFTRPEAPATTTTTDEKQQSLMVMLHVHGGGFVIGDGRAAQMGYGASMLLKHAGVRCVYCPQYRLACRPDLVPFPGALQDVLTAYLHLVRQLQIPAGNIVLSGDSAGANLVIGLLRYLVEYPSDAIPLPHSAVLFSPWVAPVHSLGPDLAVTSNPHYNTDILPPSFVRWGAAAYSRLVPASDPYISPLGHPFVTPVPMFVNLGAAEILEVDGARWVREMQKVTREVGGKGGVKENDLELNYEDGAPHDTLLVGNNLGWEDSVREVTTKIGEFIRRKSLV
ncbi:alpha/beta hydrolase fold-3 domain-containing protein [Apiospora arundinis]|uniref:Alpha/beta hydrolase fold-3 domain-containing protein n=1 Tax=Apiospora arundinis TaxID=335852 RepID=A0ABR2JJ04_9PEZI